MSKKGDLTKQRIKEQAIKIFAQRGFKDVTMKDICGGTGLSRGGLYLHYSSTRQIFAEIIDDTLALRDRYFPNAKVSVLSNSTFIHKPAVFAALNKIDNNILKLDTVDEAYIHDLDRPTGRYSVNDIIEGMKAFKGRCIIQTMFLKGSYKGKDMDNTSDKYVLPWLEKVKEIAPRQVMIYTIDRETPDHDLAKATHEELDRIGALVKEAGFAVSVSY